MRLAGPVDLPATLQGGQAFRWRLVDGSWRGVVGRRAVELRAGRAGAVNAQAWPRATATFLAGYLGLGPAEDARRARLADDPALSAAALAHPGLRILRQDPWETTAAFITSANNNVLRIEGILERLASDHGDPLKDAPWPAHAFPDARTIARATEASLRAAGLGYRAPFLRDAARMVAKGEVDLDALRGEPLDRQRAALVRLPGVGPKVADCIALFSLDATGAFPIDRWVLRAMETAFPRLAGARPRDVEAFARERWGDDAGFAQQLLFHAVRLQEAAPGTRRLT